MATFIGDFTCKLDAKGRLVLPATFKKLMVGNGSDRFVVRKDLFENCLQLTPAEQWEYELEKIRKQVNSYNRDHSRFMRAFFKGVADVNIDANGRLLIPRRLMDQIGVGREVVLIGVDKHIELWDEEAYNGAGMPGEELGQLAEKILGNTVDNLPD